MSNQKKIDSITVVVNPGSVALQVLRGSTLLEALQLKGIPISSSCGGNGTCGTCRVRVLSPIPDQLPPRNEIEAELATDRGLEANERLSCQLSVTETLNVLIPNAVPKP